MGFDLQIELEQASAAATAGGLPKQARAHVAITPLVEEQSLFVILDEFGFDKPFEIVAGHWSARGKVLPQEGAACVVVFDDEGDPWCAQWDGASDTSSVFVQEAPATSWTFDHGLGRWPIVAAYDTTGVERLPAITNPDENTVMLTFTTALAGKVVLS